MCFSVSWPIAELHNENEQSLQQLFNLNWHNHYGWLYCSRCHLTLPPMRPSTYNCRPGTSCRTSFISSGWQITTSVNWSSSTTSAFEVRSRFTNLTPCCCIATTFRPENGGRDFGVRYFWIEIYLISSRYAASPQLDWLLYRPPSDGSEWIKLQWDSTLNSS